MTTIHPNWLKPFNPKEWHDKKAKLSAEEAKHLEPRECEECRNYYLPRMPQQATCQSPNCLRARELRLKREMAALKRAQASRFVVTKEVGV